MSASVNYLWGVDSNDKIYRCNRPCTGSWVLLDGRLAQIDVGDDEVWGVASDDTIWKRPADGSESCWKSIPGGLKHVSASGNGYIWGVSSNDRIWKCKKPCNGRWINVPGKLKQIDGGHKYVYGVNINNQTYSRPVDGSGKGWRKIYGRRMIHVSASGSDDIFGVDEDYEVYRCKKPCIGEWEKIGDSMKQCDATFNGLFGVTSQYQIKKRTLAV